MWVARVKVIAGHLDEPSLFEEALVDGARLVRRGIQALFDVQQQDLAELRYSLGRPVVAPHEALAGAHGQPRSVGRL
ncbi:hypothetical protein D3C71_1059360 [compost metagenome]